MQVYNINVASEINTTFVEMNVIFYYNIYNIHWETLYYQKIKIYDKKMEGGRILHIFIPHLFPF